MSNGMWTEGKNGTHFVFNWSEDGAPVVQDGWLVGHGIEMDGPEPDPEHEGAEIVRITVHRWHGAADSYGWRMKPPAPGGRGQA